MWPTSLLFGLLAALLIGGTLAIPLVVAIDSVTSLQLSAADAVFTSEKGPHLGYQSHRQDIVLVTLDVATVKELGFSPTTQTDVELYRALLNQGAKVVADPRPTNLRGDATTVVRGLETIPDAAGHVFRNIELTASDP